MSRRSRTTTWPDARGPLAAALLCTSCLLAPPGAAAQMPADTSEPIIIVREARERWIHEDQNADAVRLQERRAVATLREITWPGRARQDWRHWRVQLDRSGASVMVDTLGRIVSLTVDTRPLSYSADGGEARTRRSLLSGVQGRGGVLRLPASRLRELWLPLPAAPLEPGTTWTDTLSFTDAPAEGVREEYTAVRRHRVVGDTVIDGVRVPRVRTEADVWFEQRLFELLLDEAWPVRRTLAGRTVGTVAVDTATGLRVAGVDTARWEGSGVLEDPVSGPLRSAIAYERIRTWSRYDEAGYAAALDSARARSPRRSTGMLILPTQEVEERLEAGDSVLADSLVRRWRETGDPAVADEMRRVLGTFGRAAGWPRTRVDSLHRDIARARGDVAGALAVTRRRIGPNRPPLTREEAESVLPYLDAPERLWRLGDPARFDHHELARMLLRASPLLEPDSSAWGCEPAACRLFLERADRFTDPRLRDAALVGRFARDPARWYDRLTARFAAGSPVVEEAMRMARGMPRENGRAVPSPGADWTDWVAWWDDRRGSGRDLRRALRLYTARTGRDPLAELVDAWPPEGEAERAAVGEMLRSLGALPPRGAEALRTALLSGDPERVRRARSEMRRRVGAEAEAVDPADVAGVLAPLVDSIFARGDAPWPPLEGLRPGGERVLHRSATSSHGVEGVPVFLIEANLPESVLRSLPPGVTRITADDWEARDRRAGGHAFRFEPVRRWGPFLVVSWNWTVYQRRAADEPPGGYAGGGSLYLVETDRGWRVAASSAWIT